MTTSTWWWFLGSQINILSKLVWRQYFIFDFVPFFLRKDRIYTAMHLSGWILLSLVGVFLNLAFLLILHMEEFSVWKEGYIWNILTKRKINPN